MDMISTIHCVISTLNDVEVKGRDNLDKLLGCIMALESVVRQTKEIGKPKEGEKGAEHAD